MFNMYYVLLTIIFTMILSFIITPIVRRIAFKIGAVDEPNHRRINIETMPSGGGLAIYIAYFISIFFLLPLRLSEITPIFIGATIIIITGLIDDIKEISPKLKILGIMVAALIVYFGADIRMTMINFPFIGELELGFWSFPLTILWIIGITNTVNLIDGLDGLAAGVSSISLITIGTIAYFFLNTGNVAVAIRIFTLVAAILGFLPYNYYPATVYLGDTGALFLGFMISVMSLYGLKNVTFTSLIIPIVILGIPITDTFFAIIRRKLEKKPISEADNEHIHHRLMAIGFNHKQTVKIIYTITFAFSIISLLYPISSFIGASFLTVGLILGLELFAELIGLVGKERRPLVTLLEKIAEKLDKYNNPGK